MLRQTWWKEIYKKKLLWIMAVSWAYLCVVSRGWGFAQVVLPVGWMLFEIARLRRMPKRPWHRLPGNAPAIVATLDELWARGELTDVDAARILAAAQRSGPGLGPDLSSLLYTNGATALMHPSGQRDLPVRIAAHNVFQGQVRIGAVEPDTRSDASLQGDFAVDLDVLRTSMLVIGPPGSGKTRGVAVPVVEHLSLEALAGRASMVVIDPKGYDFAHDGWFDITIDPLNPTHGFSLYGGARDADMGADRLASALLPTRVSDDKAYFMDASKNALYTCLAPFVAAHGRWPKVRELLSLLRCEQAEHDRVRSRLAGPEAKQYRRLLDARIAQAKQRVDPAASLLERLALLDRPALTQLFDELPPFQMQDINKPVRVRFALPEAEFPDASRILARLVVSQFVQVTTSSQTDRTLYKGLVIEEAGRFVDDYVARGIQRIRSNNAGILLFSQSIGDFPENVRRTVFGSTGCKAVFSGVDPEDAELFSTWFGEHLVPQVTVTRGASWAQHFDGRGGSTRGQSFSTWFGEHLVPQDTGTMGQSFSTSTREVERARWSVSDIINDIPHGACLVSLTRSDGRRTGPVLVNLRA
ncbi:hypothetical protein [Streptomyces olivaceiscleroticus]|uniref:TraD/TraG TraM recognition site domain-containing protein n=1 Tax=Streptomyces olivaceiscleroticus TaxID=68245 RepID=A0ABN0ZNZ9_9ACTN